MSFQLINKHIPVVPSTYFLVQWEIYFNFVIFFNTVQFSNAGKLPFTVWFNETSREIMRGLGLVPVHFSGKYIDIFKE